MLNAYLRQLGEAAHRDRCAVVLDRLRAASGVGVILDCGCGDAAVTARIAQAQASSLVVGIERNADQARVATRHGVPIVRADVMGALPIRDGAADVVVAMEVIEHLPEVDPFVMECYRVTRPGGLVVISTENLAGLHNIVALLLGNQPYTGPDVSHRHAIGHHPLNPDRAATLQERPWLAAPGAFHTKVMTAKALVQLLQCYGFQAVRALGTSYYPFPGIVAHWLGRLDWRHAAYITVVARKPVEGTNGHGG